MGLSFPNISVWPNFVCEACTVRQILKRELIGRSDGLLMALERIRLIDMAWSWSKNTHGTYQGKLRVIRHFENVFGVPILQPTHLTEPPGSPDIPLMWCMEANSVKFTTHKSRAHESQTMAFSSIRQLRSAAAQFWAWDWTVAHPSASYLTRENRLVNQACRASDSYAFTLHATGLGARLGDDVNPSLALLERHALALDADLDDQYRFATNASQRREAALGGLANCYLWLGWLRTSECFGLDWDDAVPTAPADGPSLDLPSGIGITTLT